MADFRAWKILHIDLSRELPCLPSDPSLGGFYLVFWWKGIPLGEHEVPAGVLPMSAAQLGEMAARAIAPAVAAHHSEIGFRAPLPEKGYRAPSYSRLAFRDLTALSGSLDDMLGGLDVDRRSLQGEDLSISVAVCTRDRPGELEHCLRSLCSMTVPATEIVVVDNNPATGETLRVVSGVRGVRYVPEERHGLGIARNTAIRESHGRIIAFIDDDAEAHPDWVYRLLNAFSSPHVKAVTGLILPAQLETEAEYQFQHGSSEFKRGYCPLEFDAGFFRRTKARGAPVWHVGAGANMAFSRDIFAVVGGFDERLGAGASGCSEDSELWYRILAAGWSCYYEPTAVVHHYFRSTEKALREQSFQYMRGHMAALFIQFEKHHHWGNLVWGFGVLPVHYLWSALRSLFRGGRPGINLAREQIRGCLAGIWFYLTHRSSQRLIERGSGNVG